MDVVQATTGVEDDELSVVFEMGEIKEYARFWGEFRGGWI
jgi:hypothetical protein